MLKYTTKIISLILLVSVSLLFTRCNLSKNGHEERFQTWEAAPHDNIAIITMLDEDELYYDGKEIKFQSILEDYFCPDSYWDGAILAVIGDYTYGITERYERSDDVSNLILDIFRLNLDTQEVEVLHSRQYKGTFKDPYWKVSGMNLEEDDIKYYYEDSNITIFDGETVVIFNINSLTAEEYPPERFVGSPEKYTFTYLYPENLHGADLTRVIISNGEESRTITIDYMAERNEYIQEIEALGTLKTVFGEVDPLGRFFWSWNVIGDKIYFIGRIMDQDGESSGVIFRYDYENETVEYIYNHFTNDAPEMYIVPRE